MSYMETIWGICGGKEKKQKFLFGEARVTKVWGYKAGWRFKLQGEETEKNTAEKWLKTVTRKKGRGRLYRIALH